MSGQLARLNSRQDPMVERSIEFLSSLLEGTGVKPFSIRFWNGAEWHYPDKGKSQFTIELRHPGAMRKLFWRPTELSLGEAYIFDDFDIHGNAEASFELGQHLLERNWRLPEKIKLGQKLFGITHRHAAENGRGVAKLNGRPHSRKRDAEAIQYHYNVSNDFYRLWLDQRMVYSCAFFHSQDDSLDDAQYRKLDYLCRKLRLKPEERLLDIGCGWGGLIQHATEKYGVNALGITLSQPQADLANEQFRKAGLADRCKAIVCDYRDVKTSEPFDKIVSVGMFEHVGESKLPEYFKKAYQLLKTGGVFLNHGITQSLNWDRQSDSSFIDKYVFPDGELLPISSSLKVAEECGFEIRDVEGLREHYAMTLRHWVKRLEKHKDLAIALTCPTTYRIWRIYMAGSAFNFEKGNMGLYQTLLVKSDGQFSGLPLTRCDWYRPCPSGFH